MIDWFIRFNVLHMYSLVLHTKGGLISERSSLRSPKKMPNHSPEHYPPKGEYRRIWNMDRDLAPSFYSKWKLFEIKQPFSAFETKLSIFWTKWISSISCVNAKRCDVDGGGGGKGGGQVPVRGATRRLRRRRRLPLCTVLVHATHNGTNKAPAAPKFLHAQDKNIGVKLYQPEPGSDSTADPPLSPVTHWF